MVVQRQRERDALNRKIVVVRKHAFWSSIVFMFSALLLTILITTSPIAEERLMLYRLVILAVVVTMSISFGAFVHSVLRPPRACRPTRLVRLTPPEAYNLGHSPRMCIELQVSPAPRGFHLITTANVRKTFCGICRNIATRYNIIF